jgi:hypothetical protein
MISWRHDINSTNVASLGWDTDGGYVKFHSGGTYFYRGVSRQRMVAMLRAASPGKYFRKKIYPNYEWEKIA